MTFPSTPRNRPEAKELVKKLESRGIEPDAYALNAYAALQLLVEAAHKVKSTDAKKIADDMRSGTNFKTVIGDLSFDKQGDRTRSDYAVYIWKKSGDRITFSELP
jgi:branched-chain amino acid transport system substrate-binding protein